MKTNIEDFFQEEKGITVDGARNSGVRYTAIDICRFAMKYHDKEIENKKSKEIEVYEKFLDSFTDKDGIMKPCNPDAIFNFFANNMWR